MFFNLIDNHNKRKEYLKKMENMNLVPFKN